MSARFLSKVIFAVVAWALATGCASRPAAVPTPEQSQVPVEEEKRDIVRREAIRRAESDRLRSRQARPAPERAHAARRTNPNVARSSQYYQVRVFYATDRRMEDPEAVGAHGHFGGARNSGDDPLTYGSVFVSVPLNHKVGAIERPSLLKLEFSEQPSRHMVILRRTLLDAESFHNQVRESLRRSGRSSSFVFVHGYNVTFDDAARRTAQITYDLDFGGAPVFYSWPSQGKLEGYTTDENNVEWSQHNLKRFLLEYAQKSEAQDIYLIAHSMGNRALTRALSALFTEHPEMRGRFKEIILTAPDLDAEVFKEQIAPKLVDGCDKITLYVSNSDKALLASKKLHGNYPRVGDSSDGIRVVGGIETVDASGLDTSFLEHSYFAEIDTVLSDIRKVVRQGLRAAQRGLHLEKLQSGERFWRIREHAQTP
jgi:esterase/lipase superfamily enzyme